MSRSNLITAIIGLALVLGVAWYLTRRPSVVEVQDLVDLFPKAEKKTDRIPKASAFAVETVTIDGQAKRSIVARPSARIIFGSASA